MLLCLFRNHLSVHQSVDEFFIGIIKEDSLRILVRENFMIPKINKS